MMLRTEETAEDSLAEIRARIKLGMAMAATMRMIATTISNSINENPLSFCILTAPSRAVVLHNRITVPGEKACIPGANLAEQPQAVQFMDEVRNCLRIGGGAQQPSGRNG